MKRLKMLILIFFISLTQILAQQKQLSLKQVTLEARKLYPGNLNNLSWIPSSNEFSYIKNNGNPETLVSQSVEDSSEKVILDLNTLNKILISSKLDSLNSFPQIEWVDNSNFRFWLGKKLYDYNLKNNSLELTNTVNDEAENIDYPTNYLAAFTVKNNLFIASRNKIIQVTNDNNENIVNGQAVHRNEFGINKGTFWSPNQNYLAFYRMDQTMVTDYPIVDFSERPAKVKPIKYPMAGMTSHQVTIGVYNLKTKKTVWLQTGEPKDQYLTGITWSPDEKYIYIVHLNRDQNHLRLVRYSVKTGLAVKTLFEETNDKYVEPESGPIFHEKDSNIFLWLSERDGWNHIYLYDANGNMIRQLTKGNWEVTSFDGFDKRGLNIYFYATKDGALNSNYYKQSLNTAEITRISNGFGSHFVKVSSDAKYFLDSFSSVNIPRNIELLKSNGEKVRNIFSSKDPMKEFFDYKIKISSIKNEEGTELYYKMIYPENFDSTKKYPVLYYVYGGPHVQLVTDSYLAGYRPWFVYMAQKGYLVFTLDSRGSANRGLKFEQETFRQLGTKEIEDQKTAANFLKSLPFVDADNMGVFGWSYGGFMTTSLMTRTPELFKIGVAGGAVIDWSYYEVMYTERYMDTPQTNPKGYKNSSLLNYVDNLKGKLLLVHGTSDPVVVWQHTLMFAEKAAHLGIPLDYFPYVGHQHGVVGVDTYHLYDKITEYFDNNLK